MAAKKKQVTNLLRPSEFSSRPENNLDGKAAGPKESNIPKKSDSHLVPPSKYALGKDSSIKRPGIARGVKLRPPSQLDRGVGRGIPHPSISNLNNNQAKTKQISDRLTSERINSSSDLDQTQQPPKGDTKKDFSAQLLMEIQSCKEQNQKLHTELTTQLQKLSQANSIDKTMPSADLNGLDEALLHIHRNHERSLKFHDLMESKVQKQADTIERVMQQFFEHQSELKTGNEKLSRKLFRIQEEHRDDQLHLEKQLDLKEKQCNSYKQSLQESEEKCKELEMRYKMEVTRFKKDVRIKDEMIANLEKANQTKDNDIRDLQNGKEKELNKLRETANSQILTLEEALSKYQKDFELEKQELYKVKAILFRKDKEVEDIVNSKDDEIERLANVLKKRENELNMLNTKIEKNNDNFVTQRDLLRKDMQKKIENLEENCSKIKSDYEFLLKKEKQNSEALEGSLEIESKELEKLKSELKDLHCYVAEKELESSSESLKIKTKLLEDENLQLRGTCQSLESAVELLNVRLLSLNNIIKIQETELSKDGIHITGGKSEKMISAWRDKVYSLLVQLKSHQILENEDLIKLQNKLKYFQKQLQDQSSRISLLENQLAEKTADNEMQSSKIVSLCKEVAILEEKYNRLMEQKSKFKQCHIDIISNMSTFKDSCGKEIEKLENGLKLFRSLDGRVSFAYKRLNTIQDLFQRKENIWKSRLDKAGTNRNEDDENEELSVYDKQSLLAEMKSLTDERQLLRNKIKADSEKMATFERDLVKEYKEKIEIVEDEMKKLQFEAETMRKENSALKITISKLEEEKNEMKEENQSLKFDSARMESKFKEELAQKLDSEKEVFREEFSKMERVINDTKREHTKAIVSLQQLERQMQWQKQNNEKMVKESEEMHSHEMNKLKQIARELEKERNILLTTIKQENIKMPRLKHAGLKSCDAQEDDVGARIASRPIRKQTSHPKDRDGLAIQKETTKEKDNSKLSLMLKELQSISASVLKGDKSFGETEPNLNDGNTSEEL